MKTNRFSTRQDNPPAAREQDRMTGTPLLPASSPGSRGEPLLTDDEAAHLLALSVATLKKWRRIRRGPRYYRLGSAIRYRREDLESFLSGSAANPSSGRHEVNSER